MQEILMLCPTAISLFIYGSENYVDLANDLIIVHFYPQINPSL